jgi:lipopolysaccharide/colanic/teichoic acid biosynthesis glycosyltransferase
MTQVSSVGEFGGIDRKSVDVHLLLFDTQGNWSMSSTQISVAKGTKASAQPARDAGLLIKRIIDIVLSLLLLVLTFPVMIVIALVIKVETSGPVLFVQYRYGLNGKAIKVYKYRTMYYAMTDEYCKHQTTRADPRVTRAGAFLRRRGLDELPQLLNVFWGNMSLVGPRPHALMTSIDGRLLGDIIDCYTYRHRMKPGITGWAQVNGWRGEIDAVHKLVKRLEYDLYYVENWSLWLDLKVLLKTAVWAWRDAGAY